MPDLSMKRTLQVFSHWGFTRCDNCDESDDPYDTDAIKTLVNAFVTHDACGLLQSHCRRITEIRQRQVLNAVTRLVSGIRKYDRGLSSLLHDDATHTAQYITLVTLRYIKQAPLPRRAQRVHRV